MSLFTRKMMLLNGLLVACVLLLFCGTVSSATMIEPPKESTQVIIELDTVSSLELEKPQPTSTPENMDIKAEIKKLKSKKVKYLYSTGRIRVRNKNSKKSSSKALLSPGQKVKIKKLGKWVKVQAGKKTGYVSEKFLVSSKKKAIKLSQQKTENFRLTGYCPCRQCSEGWGRTTKSGKKATAGRTIAADLSVLPMGTEVFIEGMGTYQVEDIGGGVNGKHIDVFCSAHSQCRRVTKASAKVIEIEG